jgi:hypothetical protein
MELDLLAQFGLTLVGGAIGAYVTNHISLTGYYRQKWWEARLNAYVTLIESLHDIRNDLMSNADAIRFADDPTDAFYKNLETKTREAWAKIYKTADSGEFLLSKKISEDIHALYTDFDAVPKPPANASDSVKIEVLEKQVAVVDRCLAAIRKSSRGDLGLPNS